MQQFMTELRLLVTSGKSDVKVSVLVATIEPLLDAAAEILPDNERLKDKKGLLADAQQTLCTYALSSKMRGLVSCTQNSESTSYLILGKMHFEGLTVKKDYEKSASSFYSASSCGSAEISFTSAGSVQEGSG